MHTFFVVKTIYAFFCRENDLRTSSGKFLRVESCHPESSDFLGLCFMHLLCSVMVGFGLRRSTTVYISESERNSLLAVQMM